MNKKKYNKPVKNRVEFEKLQKALETFNVVRNHVPSHQENEGKPDCLASKSTVIYVPAPVLDTESSEEENALEQKDLNLSRDHDGLNRSYLKEELQKSFSQFDQSISNRGINSSAIETKSMLWNHEGLERTHVAEGEEDEELLDALHSLDQCGEYDDNKFSERVQRFLRDYKKNARTNPTKESNLKLFNETENSTCDVNKDALSQTQDTRKNPGWLKECSGF